MFQGGGMFSSIRLAISSLLAFPMIGYWLRGMAGAWLTFNPISVMIWTFVSGLAVFTPLFVYLMARGADAKRIVQTVQEWSPFVEFIGGSLGGLVMVLISGVSGWVAVACIWSVIGVNRLFAKLKFGIKAMIMVYVLQCVATVTSAVILIAAWWERRTAAALLSKSSEEYQRLEKEEQQALKGISVWQTAKDLCLMIRSYRDWCDVCGYLTNYLFSSPEDVSSGNLVDVWFICMGKGNQPQYAIMRVPNDTPISKFKTKRGTVRLTPRSICEEEHVSNMKILDNANLVTDWKLASMYKVKHYGQVIVVSGLIVMDENLKQDFTARGFTASVEWCDGVVSSACEQIESHVWATQFLGERAAYYGGDKKDQAKNYGVQPFVQGETQRPGVSELVPDEDVISFSEKMSGVFRSAGLDPDAQYYNPKRKDSKGKAKDEFFYDDEGRRIYSSDENGRGDSGIGPYTDRAEYDASMEDYQGASVSCIGSLQVWVCSFCDCVVYNLPTCPDCDSDKDEGIHWNILEQGGYEYQAVGLGNYDLRMAASDAYSALREAILENKYIKYLWGWRWLILVCSVLGLGAATLFLLTGRRTQAKIRKEIRQGFDWIIGYDFDVDDIKKIKYVVAGGKRYQINGDYNRYQEVIENQKRGIKPVKITAVEFSDQKRTFDLTPVAHQAFDMISKKYQRHDRIVRNDRKGRCVIERPKNIPGMIGKSKQYINARKKFGIKGKVDDYVEEAAKRVELGEVIAAKLMHANAVYDGSVKDLNSDVPKQQEAALNNIVATLIEAVEDLSSLEIEKQGAVDKRSLLQSGLDKARELLNVEIYPKIERDAPENLQAFPLSVLRDYLKSNDSYSEQQQALANHSACNATHRMYHASGQFIGHFCVARVGERAFLCFNKHYLDPGYDLVSEDGKYLQLKCHTNHPHGQMKIHSIPVCEIRYWGSDGASWAIPSRNTLNNLAGGRVKILPEGKDVVCVIAACRPSTGERVPYMARVVRRDDALYWWGPNEQGMCGCPIKWDDGHIVGFHRGRQNLADHKGDENFSAGQAFTQEFFRVHEVEEKQGNLEGWDVQIINPVEIYRCFGKRINDDQRVVEHGINIEYSYQQVFPSRPMRMDPYHEQYCNENNIVERSIMLPAAETVKACWKQLEFISGGDQYYPNTELDGDVEDLLFALMSEETGKFGMMSLEDAINGSEVRGGMATDTSLGFGFGKLYKTTGEWLEHTPDMFIKYCELDWEALNMGKPIAWWSKVSSKKELRDSERVLMEKTRMMNPDAKPVLVTSLRLMGELMEKIRVKGEIPHSDSFFTGGLSIYRLGWHSMINYVTGGGVYMPDDLDVSAWDKKMSMYWILLNYALMSRLCETSHHAWLMKAHGMRTVCTYWAADPVGVVFMPTLGWRSGALETFFTNSLGQVRIFARGFLKHVQSETYSTTDFRRCFFLKTCGDDTVCGNPFGDLSFIIQVYKEYGWTAEYNRDNNARAESIEQVLFMGHFSIRVPVKSSRYASLKEVFLPALPEERVRAIPEWRKEEVSLEIYFQAMVAARMKAFPYLWYKPSVYHEIYKEYMWASEMCYAWEHTRALVLAAPTFEALFELHFGSPLWFDMYSWWMEENTMSQKGEKKQSRAQRRAINRDLQKIQQLEAKLNKLERVTQVKPAKAKPKMKGSRQLSRVPQGTRVVGTGVVAEMTPALARQGARTHREVGSDFAGYATLPSTFDPSTNYIVFEQFVNPTMLSVSRLKLISGMYSKYMIRKLGFRFNPTAGNTDSTGSYIAYFVQDPTDPDPDSTSLISAAYASENRVAFNAWESRTCWMPQKYLSKTPLFVQVDLDAGDRFAEAAVFRCVYTGGTTLPAGTRVFNIELIYDIEFFDFTLTASAEYYADASSAILDNSSVSLASSWLAGATKTVDDIGIQLNEDAGLVTVPQNITDNFDLLVTVYTNATSQSATDTQTKAFAPGIELTNGTVEVEPLQQIMQAVSSGLPSADEAVTAWSWVISGVSGAATAFKIATAVSGVFGVVMPLLRTYITTVPKSTNPFGMTGRNGRLIPGLGKPREGGKYAKKKLLTSITNHQYATSKIFDSLVNTAGLNDSAYTAALFNAKATSNTFLSAGWNPNLTGSTAPLFNGTWSPSSPYWTFTGTFVCEDNMYIDILQYSKGSSTTQMEWYDLTIDGASPPNFGGSPNADEIVYGYGMSLLPGYHTLVAVVRCVFGATGTSGEYLGFKMSLFPVVDSVARRRDEIGTRLLCPLKSMKKVKRLSKIDEDGDH